MITKLSDEMEASNSNSNDDEHRPWLIDVLINNLSLLLNVQLIGLEMYKEALYLWVKSSPPDKE